MNQRPARVVIVGAGFGGLRAAGMMRTGPVQVTLIDRNNYHLFQPLLYQVATAGLEPEQVARPVRAILRSQDNLSFLMAEVKQVDLDARVVMTGRGDLEYDYLILAAGAETNTFGLPGVETHGLQLKTLDDAVRVRNHVLRCFERAVWLGEREQLGDWLNFVVVGGGPTGVEMAGSLVELVQFLMMGEFKMFTSTRVTITLVELEDRLLPQMSRSSSEAALRSLCAKGVDVRLGTAVRAYDGLEIEFEDGESMATRTLIWAAGVSAAGLLQDLDAPHGPNGRVTVEPTLQLGEHPEVYVVGDGAFINGGAAPLPMMAPVALQMAEKAAENILRDIAGQEPIVFVYKDPGRLATIGRNIAVAEFGRLRFKGFLAWVVWLLVHLVQLVGFRNRLMVLISWAWEYLTYERAVRLIQDQYPVHKGR